VTRDTSAQLYRTYAPAIYARCRRILGDAVAAEDATQETFVRVHRHLASAPDPQRALYWIYRIATNYCLNELRARGHRPQLVDDIAERVAPDCGSADRLGARDLVHRILAHTSEQTRQVAWLYHVDGLEQQEVSDVLGISRRTVVTRLAEFARSGQRYVRRTAV
jgi:RNA polymerase sigma-70 factor (ECF subfamily)